MGGTIGVALFVCMLSSWVISDRLHQGKIELGLEIHSFSITLMELLIVVEKTAPNCPIGSADNLPPDKIHVPLPPSYPTKSQELLSQPLQLYEHGLILELANEASVYAVNNKWDSLNGWNSKVGDGDCSSTMYKSATTILDDIKNIILLLMLLNSE
ncbi:hypothetical protein V6N11_051553 [Hibiscus sabdariffa]|uniref:DhaL domain-containing protein n=1 Tax=Hibiscus sabdariffa TaxID=183260 RepID=A0ABR2U7N3_9ROSI